MIEQLNCSLLDRGDHNNYNERNYELTTSSPVLVWPIQTILSLVTHQTAGYTLRCSVLVGLGTRELWAATCWGLKKGQGGITWSTFLFEQMLTGKEIHCKLHYWNNCLNHFLLYWRIHIYFIVLKPHPLYYICLHKVKYTIPVFELWSYVLAFEWISLMW